MDEASVFLQSNKDLLPVILQIQESQWTQPVPPEMSWKPGQTLRNIVNYHVYDDAWVPDVLAGKTAAQVGDRWESLLTTTSTLREYEKYNLIAQESVAAFVEFDRTVHLSYGDFTAREYLQHITLFRGFRVYDLSRFLGIKADFSELLVQGLWDIVFPKAKELRAMHVIGEEIAVPADAPLLQRLLGLTGRSPA